MEHRLTQEMPFPERTLQDVLDDLSRGCGKYVTLARDSWTDVVPGRTKLDRERHRLLVRDLVSWRVGWLLACLSLFNMLVYLRDGSAQFYVMVGCLMS